MDFFICDFIYMITHSCFYGVWFLNPSEIETQHSSREIPACVSSLLSIIKTIDLGMEKSFPLKWRDGIEINP